jgi:hypothetical protein
VVRWGGFNQRVLTATAEAALPLDATATGEAVGAAPTESDSSVAVRATPTTREVKGGFEFSWQRAEGALKVRRPSAIASEGSDCRTKRPGKYCSEAN